MIDSVLKSILISNTLEVTLQNISAIPSTVSIILVPDLMVDFYKSASNWCYFKDIIRPSSEYEKDEFLINRVSYTIGQWD